MKESLGPFSEQQVSPIPHTLVNLVWEMSLLQEQELSRKLATAKQSDAQYYPNLETLSSLEYEIITKFSNSLKNGKLMTS